MGVGDHIHWYVTGRCNLKCNYCFKPKKHYSESRKKLEELARILVSNNVKKVTIGGGEPTLVRSLEKVLEILKNKGIYISLHTNGILLGKRNLKGLVDDVGLPIDSMCPYIQKRLRGKKFMPVFNNLSDIADKLLKDKIQVGYHTVFTAANFLEVGPIYQYIKQKDFKYWRIYEFNSNLAEDDSLNDLGTLEKGCTDSLFAKFLKMEKIMKEHNDERIQFVGVKDYKQPYAFLDNSGDISFYCWFSGRKRRVLGNIIKDGFDFVRKRLQEVHEKVFDFDDKAMDEFNEATLDTPIWARLDNGDYSDEEIEMIDKIFLKDVEDMAKLYVEREVSC